VVVFGRGASGKSTLCRRLAAVTGLPLHELDSVYWDETLTALSPQEWSARQGVIARTDRWIMDGDLGPHDVTEPRLTRADTVVIVDTGLVRCIWRALRRGRQRRDFWVWVLTWGVRYRPKIVADIHKFAPDATLVTLSSARQIDTWLAAVGGATR
jgi:adenylate kinase family enzyme